MKIDEHRKRNYSDVLSQAYKDRQNLLQKGKHLIRNKWCDPRALSLCWPEGWTCLQFVEDVATDLATRCHPTCLCTGHLFSGD